MNIHRLLDYELLQIATCPSPSWPAGSSHGPLERFTTCDWKSPFPLLPSRTYCVITTLKTQLWAAISMLMPQTHYNRHGSVFNRFSNINFIHLARSSYPQLMITTVLRDRKRLSLMRVAPRESSRTGGPWSSGPCAHRLAPLPLL